jgi:hypothetical protein
MTRFFAHMIRRFSSRRQRRDDVWIEVALGEIERAKQTIDSVPEQHPFELRYHQIEKVE